MGKGDKKSRKGKIAMGSYGKSRPHHFKKDAPVAVAKEEKAEPAKPEKVKKPSA
jgi:30S ribosomal protein S31